MHEPFAAEGVLMGSAAGADIQPRLGLRPSRRLLRLAGDDRLVQQIQRGSEPAFEVAFERHAPSVLGFCRHMLGSREEAEDAVQHTFAAAYADLQRDGEREIALKPWLFTIARNRCLSLLRARREAAPFDAEPATEGLAAQVERRADLRRLLADLRELPEEQREALLLAEAGGLSQADVAAVLGCEVQRVKGLVYRARSALMARREARELRCESVREQLANLRGGSLRRNELRLHLRECPGCRSFREQVREQRGMLAIALPVAPTLGLKANVLAAIGIGGAGGGAAIAGGAAAGGAAGGAGAVSGAAKIAAVAAIAIGGGGTAVVVSEHPPRAHRDHEHAQSAVAPSAPRPAGPAGQQSTSRPAGWAAPAVARSPDEGHLQLTQPGRVPRRREQPRGGPDRHSGSPVPPSSGEEHPGNLADGREREHPPASEPKDDRGSKGAKPQHEDGPPQDVETANPEQVLDAPQSDDAGQGDNEKASQKDKGDEG
jgi:RNA polymerase sigma factor (sigma-70 family)